MPGTVLRRDAAAHAPGRGATRSASHTWGVAYPLTGPRLRIEPLEEADIEAFVAYRQNPDVARFQSWDATYSEQDAARLIAGQPEADLPAKGRWLQLAVRDAAMGVLLGDVAVHALTDQP